MEREKVELTNDQWKSLVHENYLEIDGKEIDFSEIEDNYDGSRRHTEDHHKILKRLSDGKYFKLDYEDSVKDEMGWCECNYGDTIMTEVFPEIVTITKYI